MPPIGLESYVAATLEISNPDGPRDAAKIPRTPPIAPNATSPDALIEGEEKSENAPPAGFGSLAAAIFSRTKPPGPGVAVKIPIEPVETVARKATCPVSLRPTCATPL